MRALSISILRVALVSLALVLLVIALLIFLLFNKVLGVDKLYGGTRK